MSLRKKVCNYSHAATPIKRNRTPQIVSPFSGPSVPDWEELELMVTPNKRLDALIRQSVDSDLRDVQMLGNINEYSPWLVSIHMPSQYKNPFDGNRQVRGFYWNNEYGCDDEFVATYGLPSSGSKFQNRQMYDHSLLDN